MARMTTFFLVRHATNDALQKGIMYGRLPGVHLNEEGLAQAQALAERLTAFELAAVYSSPLDRALETAEPIAAHQGLEVIVDVDFSESDVGRWTGQSFKKLQRRRKWRRMLIHSSGFQFPSGEGFWDVQVRMVKGVERVRAKHPKGNIALVSHGDPLRLLVAHYLGLPLDVFRRLVIEPASLTVLHLGRGIPHLVRLNDTSHHPVAPDED